MKNKATEGSKINIILVNNKRFISRGILINQWKAGKANEKTLEQGIQMANININKHSVSLIEWDFKLRQQCDIITNSLE